MCGGSSAGGGCGAVDGDEGEQRARVRETSTSKRARDVVRRCSRQQRAETGGVGDRQALLGQHSLLAPARGSKQPSTAALLH
jgi:hypothetical protein